MHVRLIFYRDKKCKLEDVISCVDDSDAVAFNALQIYNQKQKRGAIPNND